jgi:hypothetical protein
MILTREESIFLLVLVLNLVIALAYFIYGTIIAAPVKTRKREGETEVVRDNRRTYLIRFIIMILCPVVGILFFIVSQLLYLTIFRFGVNLDDVTFKKERVETQVKADEELERNVIPVEEAIAVNDKKSLRTAMMSIIRGETEGSMASIALALDAEDSETAHYAASVLSDKLNEFRMNVRKMYEKVQEEPSEETECEETLIGYMNNLLKEKIFTELEQSGFVRMMEEIAEVLYNKNKSKMTVEHYESVCLRLMETGDFEKAEKWCNRMAEHIPEELCTYTCRLKLYFTLRDRTAFFKTLDGLKKSEVVIDSETLEMIRIFS